jgi:glyoxylase I family protein
LANEGAPQSAAPYAALLWFKSIYFFDPNGHRLEISYWTTSPATMKKMKEIAPAMLDEWDRTKKPPRQAAWVHEKEFT